MLDFTPLARAQEHRGFLQVLIRELEIRVRAGGGLEIELFFGLDSPCLLKNSDKKKAATVIDRKEGYALEAEVMRLRQSKQGSSARFKFQDFFLRHASAGTIPLLGRNKDVASRLLFAREVPPQGWNIANGASEIFTELFDLEQLLLRESREELLFFNPQEASIHNLSGSGSAPPEMLLALNLWQQVLDAEIGREISFDTIAGPDCLVLNCDGQRNFAPDFFVLLNAEDFGIECCRYGLLDTAPPQIPLDGEIFDGRLLDRSIGRFEPGQGLLEGLPDQLFQSGPGDCQGKSRHQNSLSRHRPFHRPKRTHSLVFFGKAHRGKEV